MSVRTQTRSTKTVGDVVQDSDWTVLSDSGALTPTTTVQAAIIPSSITVKPGDSVTLDGSKSQGVGNLIYTWSQPRGTTAHLSSSTSPTITFSPVDNTNGGISIEHALEFHLTVHDTTKASSTAVAIVDVKPQAAPNPTPTPTPTPTPQPNIPVKFIADVVNHSSKLSDQQLQTICAAVKTQLDNDVAPYWGYTAEFNFGSPMAGHAKLGVFDHADQPGDLGWHDDQNNQVEIEIFYVGTLDDVGVTISHEMIETIGDYNAETTVPGVDPNGKPCTYFTENCDPVESDEYKVDNIGVSNFVTPAWFQLQSVPGTPDGRFDFLKKTSKPFEIDSGGYMEISYDNGKTWSEVQERKSRFNEFSGSRKRMREPLKHRLSNE